MKTLLIIWLLAGRGDVVFQYAIHYETEEQCQKAAQKEVPETGAWLSIRSYPVKHADCIVEIKR